MHDELKKDFINAMIHQLKLLKEYNKRIDGVINDLKFLKERIDDDE